MLINGDALCFLRPNRVLSQGFPSFPLLFLIVAKGLSRDLIGAKKKYTFAHNMFNKINLFDPFLICR